MILSKDIYYNAEVWTLILHLMSLTMLVFLFARLFPLKERCKMFKLADRLCGGTFLILLLLSAALILLPTNSFSINATTERISGQVEQMENRSYIWTPAYTLNDHVYKGAYLHINGERYYCAVSDELQTGDSLELLRTAGCDYVMRYTVTDAGLDTPTEVPRAAWEVIAQSVLMVTGAYLALRTAYLLIYFFFMQKDKERTFAQIFKK